VYLKKNEGVPDVYSGTQQPTELIPTVNDLREIFEWWQERKRALQVQQEPDRETQRQTYHVEKRYIEAIKRAADLEHVSIMEIVNRAFSHYFNREHE
jgi:hypothetical protein